MTSERLMNMPDWEIIAYWKDKYYAAEAKLAAQEERERQIWDAARETQDNGFGNDWWPLHETYDDWKKSEGKE